ncbi:hypothetical protein EYF80_004687 [Liparis tanakae]|uniref:Uncharacterized protein n=1 Tax=Liparis tanakae TaxID=230148 RepID=A0A4Z2J658_9TELE|nr:hypothetical protein EYF80_004687 [Liparis tanakae]
MDDLTENHTDPPMLTHRLHFRDNDPAPPISVGLNTREAERSHSLCFLSINICTALLEQRRDGSVHSNRLSTSFASGSFYSSSPHLSAAGIAAVKLGGEVAAGPRMLTLHRLTLTISASHRDRDEWSINAGARRAFACHTLSV